MEDCAQSERLVCWLQGMAALRSPQWCDAFRKVRRHVFVPQSQVDHEFDWPDGVYRDCAFITRRDRNGCPTSSSSQPSVMAHMLEFLRVEDGDCVLEIGTGTGYNAALLCERLGSCRVTTIDNQPDLVELARKRLPDAGYRACIANANGADGYPDRAPYDRVIGTCFAWPIPLPWIQQTRPGGRLVAIAPTSCVGLDVEGDGSASGHLHPWTFGFMRMRDYIPWRVSTEAEAMAVVTGEGDSRSVRHPPRILRSSSGFYTLIGFLALPYDYGGIVIQKDDSELITGLLDAGDLSWARIDWLRGRVTQGGPRRIWDRVEELYDIWCSLGAPNREEFGITVEPDGRHLLWLDGPDSGHSWVLGFQP